MKRNFYTMVAAAMLACTTGAMAQTDPGTANLTHQWTFDDGTANDVVGTAHGTLMSGATVSGKALNTSAGGYMTMPGATISVNTYTALSTETWFTSVSGANTGNHMTSYFGDTDPAATWKGYKYIYSTPSNGGNCRYAISTSNTDSPWVGETGINRTGGKIDDGKLHHMVTIIDATSITFYIDGVSVGTTALTNSNSLANVSNAAAYLAKGGYLNDPVWKGQISKFSIYNKALTADEVLFLFNKGAEESPVLTASASALAFDNAYLSETFTVTGLNLSGAIAVEATAGINVAPTSLPYNANGATVTVTYDGTTVVNGNITLTSGTTVVTIPVRSASTTGCFTPLYTGQTNLVSDPNLGNLANFGGWGTKSINIDPAFVYCGARSGKIAGGGSIDVVLTGALKVNTQYRVKAKVYCIGGTFQIGFWGWSSGQADLANVSKTTDAWEDIDFTLTTGATLGATQGMFFNNYNLTGTTGYIDNWEAYEVPLATGVDEVAQQLNKVYAAANTVVAEFELAKASDVKVSVYDLQGKLMAENFNQYGAGFNKVVVDASLPKGLYIVKVVSDEFAVSTKLIK